MEREQYTCKGQRHLSIYKWKETSFRDTDTFDVWSNRPVYMKRNQYTLEKRPIYMERDQYIKYKKRPPFAILTLLMCVKTGQYTWNKTDMHEKRPIYDIWKKSNIQEKRISFVILRLEVCRHVIREQHTWKETNIHEKSPTYMTKENSLRDKYTLSKGWRRPIGCLILEFIFRKRAL